MSALSKEKLILSSIIVLVVLVAISFIGTGYFYFRYRQTQTEIGKLLTNPQQILDRENKYIVEKVSTIMTVPTDETPQVVTINNLDQLKNQPFFANAKVGYKLLVFQEAKKAILYDPVSGKIIEVGPVSSPSPTTTPPGEEQGNFTLPSPTRIPTNTPIPTLSPTPPEQPQP